MASASMSVTIKPDPDAVIALMVWLIEQGASHEIVAKVWECFMSMDVAKDGDA